MTLANFKISLRALWIAVVARDHFPAISAKIRHALYQPLGVVLLAALAAALCGLFLHAQGFVLCASLVGIVLLGIAWPWLCLRGISGELVFLHTRVVEQEPVTVQLSVSSQLPWSAYGLALKGGFGEANDVSSAGLNFAASQCITRCQWPWLPPQRGIYPRSSTVLATGFPFGMWESNRAIVWQRPLIVWPKTWPVGPIPANDSAIRSEGTVSRGKAGHEGDLSGVRPYRRGDSPRRIHWAQTARHDQLIVCELQALSRPTACIVLDVDTASHRQMFENENSIEWVVRIAASIACGWVREGAHIGLMWQGGAIPLGAGSKHIENILDACAKIEPSNASTISHLLQVGRKRIDSDVMHIIVTTVQGYANRGRFAKNHLEFRWVVIGHDSDSDIAEGQAPWLRIQNSENIPAQLRHGWREARHGS